jgi:hypothetical protein
MARPSEVINKKLKAVDSEGSVRRTRIGRLVSQRATKKEKLKGSHGVGYTESVHAESSLKWDLAQPKSRP